MPYPLRGGDSNLTFDFMLAVMIITMIVVGIIGGMSAEKLADAFAKGLGSMAFVAFVIGLAKVISLVLADGNVIHTIVYVLTKPLMSLPKSVSSVGLTLIVSVTTAASRPATSKAATWFLLEAGSRSTGLTSEPCSCSLSDGRQLYQPVYPRF